LSNFVEELGWHSKLLARKKHWALGSWPFNKKVRWDECFKSKKN